MSFSRTHQNASGEAQTIDPLTSSQALYHCALLFHNIFIDCLRERERERERGREREREREFITQYIYILAISFV